MRELLANAESHSCDVSQTEIKALCESWLAQNENLEKMKEGIKEVREVELLCERALKEIGDV